MRGKYSLPVKNVKNHLPHKNQLFNTTRRSAGDVTLASWPIISEVLLIDNKLYQDEGDNNISQAIK